MVQKYVVELVDDLDGSVATDTITFGLDGASYVIDLSDDHINELRSLLDPYVSAARKGDATAKPTAKSKVRSSSAQDLGAIREWANTNGFTVSARGRVPGIVLDAYKSAHDSRG